MSKEHAQRHATGYLEQLHHCTNLAIFLWQAPESLDNKLPKGPTQLCWILSADQNHSKKSCVRNDNVTYANDNMKENRGKQMMTANIQDMKKSHKQRLYQVERITPKTTQSELLTTCIETTANKTNKPIVSKKKK
ncbi:hypothetical protein PCANC_22924 [Puccinia coronata f. sp. avenae]|uniref:Uncharacterized protein n=1 Tax=Puccinia coronata f. sp. avenae TaxID=200324 RepID=A0A2N5UDU7_9BASI|nr:hypothetical protein PCANC_22924 [Puccinia coronata f. sp. avenae]